MPIPIPILIPILILMLILILILILTLTLILVLTPILILILLSLSVLSIAIHIGIEALMVLVGLVASLIICISHPPRPWLFDGIVLQPETHHSLLSLLTTHHSLPLLLSRRQIRSLSQQQWWYQLQRLQQVPRGMSGGGSVGEAAGSRQPPQLRRLQ